MISTEILESQAAVELPDRDMMNLFDLNIAVPIMIQNNISVQVCGVGYGNTATCNTVQGNFGGIDVGQWGG